MSPVLSSFRTPLRRAARTVLPLALLAASAPSGLGAQAADSALFVTRLGRDTIAVERVRFSANRVDADVVLRVPRTARTTYAMELSPSGELSRLESTTLGPNGEVARREVITRAGDTLRVETTMPDGQTRQRVVAAPGNALPFIDMVHWPFELALVRARQASGGKLEQPLLTGARTTRFPIAVVGDSGTITHPSRGTMRVAVDARGRLLGLDAAATTRKLVLERRPWGPIESFAERWAAEDAAGRSLGALSGRATPKATVAGAEFEIDHGTPVARGRAIWGALVPFGQVWRTGANEATHFSTSRDIVLGAGADTLAVPAGRYMRAATSGIRQRCRRRFRPGGC